MIKHVLRQASSNLIRWAYFKCNISHVDRLNAIALTKPTIYKPTADGNLLIDWHRFFSMSSHSYLPRDVENVFKNIVQTTEQEDLYFDISEIDSCTASSSFGEDYFPRINGSWFDNLTAWGEGMYIDLTHPTDTFSRTTDKDWEYNVNHVRNQALKKDFNNIFCYTWLNNRLVLSQSGGSHHLALVLAQKKAQNRNFTIKAKIKTYTINLSELKNLCKEYYFIVTGETAYDNFVGTLEEADSIVTNVISNTRRHLYINNSPNRAILFVIKKSSLKVNKTIFDEWIGKQIDRGTIIDFVELVESTNKYCTTPYLHKISQIQLGDCFRRNETELLRLKGLL